MKDEKGSGSEQASIREVLQFVGPMLAGAGLLFTGVGLISFINSMGSFAPPRLFWCMFVGMPLLAVGAAMSQAGYIRAISRYFSREVAPVQKDTFNYLAEGTSPGVEAIARAVGAGFAAGTGEAHAPETPCSRCGVLNPPDSKFCGQCGAAFAAKSCPRCHEVGEPNARFCTHCGAEFA